eukprot:gene9442-14645_t
MVGSDSNGTQGRSLPRGAVKQVDMARFRKLAEQVLESQRHKDLVLKVFRIVCSHGEALERGVASFDSVYEFLKEVGFATRGRQQERRRSSESVALILREMLEKQRTDDEAAAAQNQQQQQLQEGSMKDRREEALHAHDQHLDHAKEMEALEKQSRTERRKQQKLLSIESGDIKSSDAPFSHAGPARGRDRGVAISLSFLEVDALFHNCRQDDVPGLCPADFALLQLRLADIAFPDDFATSPLAALLRLLGDDFLEFISLHAPADEGDLKRMRPWQAARGVPEVISYFNVPLRKLFVRFTDLYENGPRLDDEELKAMLRKKKKAADSVDVLMKCVAFEGVIELLSRAKVVPTCASHAVVYRTLCKLSKAGVAGKREMSLSYEEFLDALLHIAFEAYHVSPHLEALPTLASRAYCLIKRFASVYNEEFQSNLAADVTPPYIPVPKLISLQPSSASPAGGTPLTMLGRHFHADRGVWVAFDDVTVSTADVAEDTVKVLTPEMAVDNFSVSVHLKEDAYQARVLYTREVTVSVSNDNVTFTPADESLRFTYVSTGCDLLLAEWQPTLHAVFAEYCSQDDFANDKYLSRKQWVKLKHDFGLEEKVPPGAVKAPAPAGARPDTRLPSRGAAGQPASLEPLFDTHCMVVGEVQCLTFKRFLLAVVSCLVARTLQEVSNCHTALTIGLKAVFSRENMDAVLARDFKAEQSSLTMGKVRELRSVLAVLKVFSAPRHDVTPDDALLEPPSQPPSTTTNAAHATNIEIDTPGVLTNPDELEQMFIAYLKRSKHVSEAIAFEHWQWVSARRDLLVSNEKASRRPRADVAFSDAVESIKNRLSRPAVREPVEPEDPDRNHAYEAAAPRGRIKRQPHNEHRAYGDDDASASGSDSVDFAECVPGRQQGGLPHSSSVARVRPLVDDQPSLRLDLLDLLVKLSYDRLNFVTRRSLITEHRLKLKVSTLEDQLAEANGQVKELKDYAKQMASCSVVMESLDREMLRHSHLHLEQVFMEEMQREQKERQSLLLMEGEDQLQEKISAEKSKFMLEFQDDLAASDARLINMAKILAKQTHWLEAQKSVVEDLQAQLIDAQSCHEGYKELCTGLDAATREADETERTKLLKSLATERTRLEARQVMLSERATQRADARKYGNPLITTAIRDLSSQVQTAEAEFYRRLASRSIGGTANEVADNGEEAAPKKKGKKGKKEKPPAKSPKPDADAQRQAWLLEQQQEMQKNQKELIDRESELNERERHLAEKQKEYAAFVASRAAASPTEAERKKQAALDEQHQKELNALQQKVEEKSTEVRTLHTEIEALRAQPPPPPPTEGPTSPLSPSTYEGTPRSRQASTAFAEESTRRDTLVSMGAREADDTQPDVVVETPLRPAGDPSRFSTVSALSLGASAHDADASDKGAVPSILPTVEPVQQPAASATDTALSLIPDGQAGVYLHVAAPGDTIESIAARFNVTEAVLEKANAFWNDGTPEKDDASLRDRLSTLSKKQESNLASSRLLGPGGAEAGPSTAGKLVVVIPMVDPQAAAAGPKPGGGGRKSSVGILPAAKAECGEIPITPGDTFESICADFSLDPDAIRRQNFLRADPTGALYKDPMYLTGIPSKVLRVPAGATQMSAAEFDKAALRHRNQREAKEQELREQARRLWVKKDDENPSPSSSTGLWNRLKQKKPRLLGAASPASGAAPSLPVSPAASLRDTTDHAPPTASVVIDDPSGITPHDQNAVASSVTGDTKEEPLRDTQGTCPPAGNTLAPLNPALQDVPQEGIGVPVDAAAQESRGAPMDGAEASAHGDEAQDKPAGEGDAEPGAERQPGAREAANGKDIDEGVQPEVNGTGGGHTDAREAQIGKPATAVPATPAQETSPKHPRREERETSEIATQTAEPTHSEPPLAEHPHSGVQHAKNPDSEAPHVEPPHAEPPHAEPSERPAAGGPANPTEGGKGRQPALSDTAPRPFSADPAASADLEGFTARCTGLLPSPAASEGSSPDPPPPSARGHDGPFSHAAHGSILSLLSTAGIQKNGLASTPPVSPGDGGVVCTAAARPKTDVLRGIRSEAVALRGELAEMRSFVQKKQGCLATLAANQ